MSRVNGEPTNEQVMIEDGVDFSGPTKFLYLVGLIDRGVQRSLQKRLAPHELSLPEYTTLSTLLSRPGLSNAELARRALVTPQSMNEVIARLERRGFIERTNHPEHGRILMAKVTEPGRKIHDQARPDVIALEEDLLQDVPEEDLPAVRRYLVGVLGRMRDHG